MKKLNLKQPKYIFPLVIFLPLAFVAYEVTSVVGGDGKKSATVATDSLNMELPEAQNEDMDGKMAGMEKRMADGDAYTAVDGLGEDQQAKDSVNSGYTESELDNIDKANAERTRQQKDQEELERTLAEQRKHVNSYAYSGSGSSSRGYRSSSRRDELDDYAKELEYIQNRSRAAQQAIDRNNGSYNGSDGYSDNDDYYGDNGSRSRRRNTRGRNGNSTITEAKPELVRKVESKNADKFNTVSSKKDIDEPLIKAMIDKTTKAHEGTRLRFKLLDDVKINKVLLKKGTYLYGLVTGFGQQRVRANITNILVGNKFIKVNLSVYDNDGMEGFYVPESAFRDMMKEAGAQAMSSNMQFGDSYGSSSLTGESVALQALQNVYQSASNAVSANIRKNKARIKYNTIVYLINTQTERQ